MFHKTVLLGEDSDDRCAHSTEAQNFQKQQTLMPTTQFLALVGYVVAGGFQEVRMISQELIKGAW